MYMYMYGLACEVFGARSATCDYHQSPHTWDVCVSAYIHVYTCMYIYVYIYTYIYI